MKRILLPTDFSENAQRAIDYALMLWGDEQVKFTLLNTYYFVHNTPAMLISLEDILHEQSEKALKENLKHIKQERRSLAIETISAYGEPPGVITEVVKEQRIDMVVMGSHGSTALKEALFGSNTTNLVKRIVKPILIVPQKYPLKIPRKIVFATDLIQVDDLEVLEPMLLLARKYLVEIIIMNVTGKDNDIEVSQALQKLDFNNHFENINYRFEVVQDGNILRGISHFLRQEQADMLVIMPKQYPNFKGMFHRSITKQMIYRAEVPVLVV